MLCGFVVSIRGQDFNIFNLRDSSLSSEKGATYLEAELWIHELVVSQHEQYHYSIIIEKGQAKPEMTLTANYSNSCFHTSFGKCLLTLFNKIQQRHTCTETVHWMPHLPVQKQHYCRSSSGSAPAAPRRSRFAASPKQLGCLLSLFAGPTWIFHSPASSHQVHLSSVWLSHVVSASNLIPLELTRSFINKHWPCFTRCCHVRAVPEAHLYNWMQAAGHLCLFLGQGF